jgi:hypothetical protein
VVALLLLLRVLLLLLLLLLLLRLGHPGGVGRWKEDADTGAGECV